VCNNRLKIRQAEQKKLVHRVKNLIAYKLLEMDGILAVGTQNKFGREVITCYVEDFSVKVPEGLLNIPIIKTLA
jgi:hypothetical protein